MNPHCQGRMNMNAYNPLAASANSSILFPNFCTLNPIMFHLVVKSHTAGFDVVHRPSRLVAHERLKKVWLATAILSPRRPFFNFQQWLMSCLVGIWYHHTIILVGVFKVSTMKYMGVQFTTLRNFMVGWWLGYGLIVFTRNTLRMITGNHSPAGNPH